MTKPNFLRLGGLAAVLALLLFWVAGGPGTRGERGVAGKRPETAAAGSGPGKAIYRLGAFDPNHHLAQHPGRKGAPLRFAEPTVVKITPETHGAWEVAEGIATWRLAVEAPGALNLNFGYSRYAMTPGGSLEFRSRDGSLLVRPFTSEDNDDHGQLWTPLFAGAEVEMSVSLPAEERDELELELTSINRGFRVMSVAAGYEKIGANAPQGNCHIDVVCSAAQSGVGAMIDEFRDEIRSAGVYTLNGIDTCSGSVVNNTSQDGTPYFLTADHCGVRSNNASTIVVYWNFENSTCRTPGSGAAGGNGDGPLTAFNMGSAFRATYAPSDFTLVELDDPIDPSVDVHYAGWSRVNTVPTSMVSIHFPNISEKRISFDFDAGQSTGDSTNSTDPNGTHWRVVDWDFGSTEGGSSGSPLFDQNGRVIGQLTGGFAACGNNESDWYGKLAFSWAGGGSASSRLSTWLDPGNTGVLTLDGTDGMGPGISIADAEVVEGNSGQSSMQFTVTLEEAAEGVVDLSYATQDISATAGEDYTVVANGMLTFAVGETEMMISIPVNGDTDPEENETFLVILSLVGTPPVALTDGEATGTISNDDFVPPVIVSPFVVNGSVASNLSAQVIAQNTPTGFSLSGEPAGMSIDNTGLLSWVPSAAGNFTAMVTATNPGGSDTEEISFVIVGSPLADAVEQYGQGFSLATGGGAGWVREASGDSINGADRAMSAAIGDGGSTWLEATLEGPEFLGFWWKSSSEVGFDFLRVEVNGEVRQRISGTTGWEYVVVALAPGSNTVRWTYEKDVNAIGGLDRVWVDFIQLASQTTPFLMEPPAIHTEPGQPVDYQIPTFRPGAVFAPTAVGAGMTLDAAGLLSGTGPPIGPVNFVLSILQDGNSLSVPATIEVLDTDPLGSSVEQPDLRWVVSGTGTWVNTSQSHGDGDALRESGVGDNGSAVLTTYVYGPGELSFWWKVSSEGGYDYLIFYLDGAVESFISGEEDWAQVSVDLSYGPHKLSWVYSKDGDTARGDDRGWLDEVTLSGYAGWILDEGVSERRSVVFDLDRDGENQFFEYASGGSATVFDPVATTTLVSGRLEWSLPKAPGVRDAYFEAEVGDDLLEWSTTERTILQDDAVLFRARDTIGIGASDRRFIHGGVGPTR